MTGEESTLQLQRVGRYRLLRELGEGAMARVYLAELDALGGFRRKVALKVVRPDYARDEKFVKLLAREAMIGSRLQHPNIVQTLEFNEDGGRHFLALQFVEGETFAELLQKAHEEGDPGLPRVLAVESVIQVLKGLSYAHSLTDADGAPFGIIHRDLKPGNIMLSRHGQVKVMDFGIAKAKVAAANITTVGQVRGTPIYMAPEQVTGKDMDGRTDQFAAATVLFELLTGEQVFVAPNLVMIMQRVARADVGDAPARADALVPGVGGVLSRMWQKKPEDRYPDCDAAATDLETLLLGGAASASQRIPIPEAPTESERRRPRKKPRAAKKKPKDGGVLGFVSGLLGRKPAPPPKKKRRRRRKRPEEASAPIPAPPTPPAPEPEPEPPPSPPETGPEMVFEDSTFGGSSSFQLQPASGLVKDGPSTAQIEQDSVPTSPSLASIQPVDAADSLEGPAVDATPTDPPEPQFAAESPPGPASDPEESPGPGELPTTTDLSPRPDMLAAALGAPESAPQLSELDTVDERAGIESPSTKTLFDPPTSEHFSISEQDVASRQETETTEPPEAPQEEREEGTVSWGNRPPGLKDESGEEDESLGDDAPMDDFFFGDFKE